MKANVYGRVCVENYVCVFSLRCVWCSYITLHRYLPDIYNWSFALLPTFCISSGSGCMGGKRENIFISFSFSFSSSSCCIPTKLSLSPGSKQKSSRISSTGYLTRCMFWIVNWYINISISSQWHKQYTFLGSMTMEEWKKKLMLFAKFQDNKAHARFVDE